MGKAGKKQKRRPKFKDKKQSERFKEAARELGADKSSDAFDRIAEEMARTDRETADHIASSRNVIEKTKEEVHDAAGHVGKSKRTIERSRRLLKKTDN